MKDVSKNQFIQSQEQQRQELVRFVLEELNPPKKKIAPPTTNMFRIEGNRLLIIE